MINDLNNYDYIPVFTLKKNCHGRLNDKEKRFLNSLTEQRFMQTAKQTAWLDSIMCKYNVTALSGAKSDAELKADRTKEKLQISKKKQA